MKKSFLFISLCMALAFASCRKEDALLTDQQVKFTFANISTSGNSKSGRISAATTDPHSVLVTIKGSDGTIVAEKKELLLYKFGDNFLSSPLTLKVTAGGYRLSEFFVTGSNNKIAYATPREGSAMAHLVADPLDIEFSVSKDSITTVVPEVVAVNDSTNAAAFGYGQFGLKPVKAIGVVISSFLKGVNNFELTNANIKIQGLSDTTHTEANVLWTYETELSSKANNIVLKEAPFYKLIATKDGYKPWTRNVQLVEGSKVEIIFDYVSGLWDVYVAGVEITGQFTAEIDYATYWKNGHATRLSNVNSNAFQIVVSGSDIYIPGRETGTKNAFYWKNGEKVIIPLDGSTEGDLYQLAVHGSDVHSMGGAWPVYTVPAYWKNTTRIPLPMTGNFTRTDASNITMDGEDVYISGTESVLGSTQKEDSYPLIWKNGVLMHLAMPSAAYRRTFTTKIIVKNGHVYVCGSTTDPVSGQTRPIYWKDNVPTILESSLPNAYPSSMAIQDDGTVHIVGFQGATNSQAIYWRNGVEGSVPQSNGAVFRSVTTEGNTMAIVGSLNQIATYWMDGKRVTLGDKKSDGRGILLVRK